MIDRPVVVAHLLVVRKTTTDDELRAFHRGAREELGRMLLRGHPRAVARMLTALTRSATRISLQIDADPSCPAGWLSFDRVLGELA